VYVRSTHGPDNRGIGQAQDDRPPAASVVAGCSATSTSPAFAAGAVLTMLRSSMMPAAFEEGSRIVALLTALGFAVAAALTLLD
jgi:hypothetical protein